MAKTSLQSAQLQLASGRPSSSASLSGRPRAKGCPPFTAASIMGPVMTFAPSSTPRAPTHPLAAGAASSSEPPSVDHLSALAQENIEQAAAVDERKTSKAFFRRRRLSVSVQKAPDPPVSENGGGTSTTQLGAADPTSSAPDRGAEDALLAACRLEMADILDAKALLARMDASASTTSAPPKSSFFRRRRLSVVTQKAEQPAQRMQPDEISFSSEASANGDDGREGALAAPGAAPKPRPKKKGKAKGGKPGPGGKKGGTKPKRASAKGKS